MKSSCDMNGRNCIGHGPKHFADGSGMMFRGRLLGGKDGRVLSAENLAKLKQAHALIAEVMADHEAHMAEEPPAEEPAKFARRGTAGQKSRRWIFTGGQA